MGYRIKFSWTYFLLAAFIFAIEVLIALFAHDKIIRPFVGDVLVVILIYCAVKTFVNTPVLKTAFWVFAFAAAIEILQYFHFVKMLGLQHSRLATIVLGNTFSWADIASYACGIAIVIVVVKAMQRRKVAQK